MFLCLKKGVPSDPTNYRPISLLPVISKILEKIFLTRLNSFLNKFNLLSKNQFGFREGFSTSDALDKLLNFIVSGLDKKQKALSVFLDLSKAFDCVNHGLLLNQLENYGIRGTPHNWLNSYLIERKQQVIIKDVLSDSTEIKYGVPQGSILGPILFLIYINNVNDLMSCENIIQYADDTTLCFTADNLITLEKLCCEQTNTCIKFYKNLNLQTNYNKSSYLNFSLKNVTNFQPKISIDDNIIKEVEYTKMLGLYIDNRLSWEKHIDITSKKISSNLFLLRKLSTVCGLNVLKIAYYGLLYPHLAYGIIFWGSCADVHLTRIFKLQKCAIRILTNSGFLESCKSKFKELEIMPLPCIYIFETIRFFILKSHKIKGEDIHNYLTRTNEIFRIDEHRLSLYSKLPSQSGAKLFNHLPPSIKQFKTWVEIKKPLRRFLILNSFYSVGEFMRHLD